MTSELELLARAKDADKRAIADLYDQYAHRIYGYLYRRVGNAQVAEDLTGDVFVKVLEAIRARQLWQVSFRAWLYRIAHNTVVDWYRRHGADGYDSVDDGQFEAVTREPGGALLADSWSHHELRAALRSLSEGQQQVIILRFGEGLKTREVAEVLGKSVGAVEALQHRALTSLRQLLEG